MRHIEGRRLSGAFAKPRLQVHTSEYGLYSCLADFCDCSGFYLKEDVEKIRYYQQVALYVAI